MFPSPGRTDDAERYLRVPDGIEPVVGARAWRIDPGGRRLLAATRDVAWPLGGPLRAACLSSLDEGHGRVPDPRCGCGVWALADPSDLPPELGYNGAFVYGIAELWGRVVVGTRGWRGEFARPVALMRALPPLPGWANLHPEMFGDRTADAALVEEVARRHGIQALDEWPELTSAEGVCAAVPRSGPGVPHSCEPNRPFTGPSHPADTVRADDEEV